MKSHSRIISRRSFLQTTALAGLAFPFVSRLGAVSANGIINHASFGATGMASSDLNAIMDTKLANLIAVAEVDLRRTEELKQKYPGVKVYQDWRELLDKEAKNIESVNISTPDHMHGAMAMAALQAGKHVYGQKPLTQNVFESRQVTLQARKSKVVTQMGIQVHSSVQYRLPALLIKDGAIGKVKEVHTWSSKMWGDMEPKPNRVDPIPAGFNWDMWLGVATERSYLDRYYHPGNWRKRLDFGTGTFGDMGCHIYDPVFKALALTAPLSIRSEGPAPNDYNWAINAVIHYVFPGTPYTDGKTVRVTWYDGEKRPPQNIQNLLGDIKLPEQGSIFIGTKGVMLLPHVGRPQLLPVANYQGYEYPELPPLNHWKQYLEAIRGNDKASANFDYAGALTETVLLGGVATRFPNQTLVWNLEKLEFRNVKEANQYLRREYRKGWEPKWIKV
ncbi:MAG: Gfo/Idh/MocA family oxidoreductase [Verrucomicrobia bacterium]|nr:Gfo/Idh/MocA family oxidoreductase [Verrucomicrobiota bacterium]